MEKGQGWIDRWIFWRIDWEIPRNLPGFDGILRSVGVKADGFYWDLAWNLLIRGVPWDSGGSEWFFGGISKYDAKWD